MNLQEMSQESRRRFGNLLCQSFPTLRQVNVNDAIALLSIARETIEDIAKKASENPVQIPDAARQPIQGYEKDLGPFEVIFRDPFCGEPVAWGFRIINHLGESRFKDLASLNYDLSGIPIKVECITEKQWAVIRFELTPALAENAYGPLVSVEVGPRCGFRAATFGTTRFTSSRVRTAAARSGVPQIQHDH